MTMARWASLLIVFSLAFRGLPRAQETSANTDASDSGRLPVKKVVLYKNGVGYFEHRARVHGSQELGIEFTTGQLNDVLKSLTVVDLGGGHISDIRYNSIAPLEERLRALRLPFGERISRVDFLSALRGARVEVTGKGESASGRLLSVEQEDRTTDSGTTYQAVFFTVVADSGEMKNFELSPALSVRLADRDLNQEVGRYLNLVGSSRARDLRRMTVAAAGDGDRDIFVSYISEVPVWKSTYRIILPERPGDKPLLQGWAIVDNTIGEDWKDVELSLIAGAPQSFIQNISQPLYARRPEIALPQSAMVSPQTHEAAMSVAQSGVGGVWAPADAFASNAVPLGRSARLSGTVTDPTGAAVSGARLTLLSNGVSLSAVTDANGRYEFAGAPAGPGEVTVESFGFQTTRLHVNLLPNQSHQINASLHVASTAEQVEVNAIPAPPRALNGRNFTQLDDLQASEVAQAQELGDYFEYKIKQPITIGKNQSALVPVLQSRIEAEKVTLWTANANQPALRALWIKNASGLMLDSGTFNIIDGGRFAGEGLIETVHPDERRLLSYAADTAVRVAASTESKNLPVSRIRILKGVMFVSRERRDKVVYTIRNSDTEARQVIIEHPVRDGWKLVAEDKPDETSASHYRFREAVDPEKTRELVVEEVHEDVTRSRLTDITKDEIDVLGTENVLTPELEAAFRRVLDQKNEISKLQSDRETRQKELEAINSDQARIRENMKALKASVEEKALLARYTRQLDSEEDRLNVLHKEITALDERQAEDEQKLESMVQHITL